MALATTYAFGKYLLKIGDGGSPEVFTDPCGLTSKGFTRTANMQDTNIPDCADPDAASWLGREAVSYSGAIAGAGVVAKESINIWEDWWTANETRNVRIELGTDLAWIMPSRIQEYAITAEKGSKVEMAIALVSDGEAVKQVIP